MTTVTQPPGILSQLFPALAEASLRRYLGGQVASVLGSWTLGARDTFAAMAVVLAVGVASIVVSQIFRKQRCGAQ